LGYGPEDRLLILHADDIGMCHASNAAYLQAVEAGQIKTGSIMVPCPWFPEIAAYCREHPDCDLGLHLTLTSEWKYYRWPPVASAAQVLGLVDPDGFLWSDVPEVVAHATPAEVEAEVRAQIERALHFGVKPTHLDSHMGTLFAKPEFLEVYCRLGKEYDIPPMLPNWSPEIEALAQEMGLPLSRDFFAGLEGQGFILLDHLLTSGSEGRTLEDRRAGYEETLRRLKPGVTQIILHPAIDGDELQHIAGSYAQRDLDFRIFTDPAMKQFIADLGIQLIGWRDLRPAWRNDK
jgi:predicted glycoside hydrolase/deacetylase ChbG (UPF0249 family)